MEDQDVIGLAHSKARYQIVVLSIRKGHLSGSREYAFKNEEGSTSEVMEAFVKQYYPREAFIPKVVLLSDPMEDQPALRGGFLSLQEKGSLWSAHQEGKKPASSKWPWPMRKACSRAARNLMSSH